MVRPFDGAFRYHDIVLTYTHSFRIVPGLACANVKFPAMPGTAQDFALPCVRPGSRLASMEKSGDAARTERSSLVRTCIPQSKVFSLQIEDTDRAPCNFYDLTVSDRNLVHCGDSILGHLSPGCDWQLVKR